MLAKIAGSPGLGQDAPVPPLRPLSLAWALLFSLGAPSLLARDPGSVTPSEAPLRTAGEALPAPEPPQATLLQTHTREVTFLGDRWPDADAVSDLLVDHVLDERHAIAPELFGLLRKLAGIYPHCRIEIVSGFRSEKRNEAMRKKGHHVAGHSQHSLGTAVDFRIIPSGSTTAVDPLLLEKQIRSLGWDGGVGVYLAPGDRFIHADVAKHRRWTG